MRIGSSEFFQRGFNRNVFRLLTGTLVCLAVVLTVSAVWIARNQNQQAIANSMRLAATALRVTQSEVARSVQNFAVDEETFRNLHLSFDVDWASSEGNLGSNVYGSLGYEFAFVISPEDETLYTTIEGQRTLVDAFVITEGGLDRLVDLARRLSVPSMGILMVGDDSVVAAASAVRSPAIERLGRQTRSPTVIVFAKKLNTPMLARVGNDFLLDRLAVRSEDNVRGRVALPLTTVDGSAVGQITWNPPQPGTRSLRLLLPLIGGFLLLFGLFAFLTLRLARRASSRLGQAAGTIGAYAETLRKSEARFRDIAEASSDWIWECDSRMRATFLSPRFTETTGLPVSALLGHDVRQFFRFGDGELRSTVEAAGIDPERAFRGLRCRFEDASGNVRHCSLAGSSVLDEAGMLVGFRGTATDVTAEVEAHARATHLALHDTLTGLPNRRQFRDQMAECLRDHAAGSTLAAVLLLDLDHFKAVNDTFGHPAGDALLREAAARLRACLRSKDTIARLGGDEFAVVQRGILQPLDALALAKRISAHLAAPFAIAGATIRIGVTIGIALPEDGLEDPSVLLKNADIALYCAKQKARGTVCLFERSMGLERLERRALEADLGEAIAQDQFSVQFQPLFSLHDERMVGVEALVRWSHPERGAVPPELFIPLAEETGFVVTLGEWVLRRACREALAWPDLFVAVNLSPVQFRHGGLVEMVEQVLREVGLSADRLELEITEGVLLQETETSLSILAQLKRLGVRIVMDDFGTGYSSLGYLNSFPFDKIKIDRSFISDLEGRKANAIVRSVIALGRSLGIVTAAEGVETHDQANFLRGEGCQQVQGHLSGKPMCRADLDAFLATKARPGTAVCRSAFDQGA